MGVQDEGRSIEIGGGGGGIDIIGRGNTSETGLGAKNGDSK